ncbi:hypothetical protein AAMO2058_000641900 [Amorphochlora amoebiformis]
MLQYYPVGEDERRLSHELESMGGGAGKVSNIHAICWEAKSTSSKPSPILSTPFTGGGKIRLKDPSRPGERKYSVSCFYRGDFPTEEVVDRAIHSLGNRYHSALLGYGCRGLGKTQCLLSLLDDQRGVVICIIQRALALVRLSRKPGIRITRPQSQSPQSSGGVSEGSFKRLRLVLSVFEITGSHQTDLLAAKAKKSSPRRRKSLNQHPARLKPPGDCSSSASNPNDWSLQEVSTVSQAKQVLSEAFSRSISTLDGCFRPGKANKPNLSHVFVRIQLLNELNSSTTSILIGDLAGVPSTGVNSPKRGKPGSTSQSNGASLRIVHGLNKHLVSFNKLLLQLAEASELARTEGKDTESYPPVNLQPDTRLTKALAQILSDDCEVNMITFLSPKPHLYLDTCNVLRIASRAQVVFTSCVRTEKNVSLEKLSVRPLPSPLRSLPANAPPKLRSNMGAKRDEGLLKGSDNALCNTDDLRAVSFAPQGQSTETLGNDQGGHATTPKPPSPSTSTSPQKQILSRAKKKVPQKRVKPNSFRPKLLHPTLTLKTRKPSTSSNNGLPPPEANNGSGGGWIRGGEGKKDGEGKEEGKEEGVEGKEEGEEGKEEGEEEDNFEREMENFLLESELLTQQSMTRRYSPTLPSQKLFFQKREGSGSGSGSRRVASRRLLGYQDLHHTHPPEPRPPPAPYSASPRAEERETFGLPAENTKIRPRVRENPRILADDPGTRTRRENPGIVAHNPGRVRSGITVENAGIRARGSEISGIGSENPEIQRRGGEHLGIEDGRVYIEDMNLSSYPKIADKKPEEPRIPRFLSAEIAAAKGGMVHWEVEVKAEVLESVFTLDLPHGQTLGLLGFALGCEGDITAGVDMTQGAVKRMNEGGLTLLLVIDNLESPSIQVKFKPQDSQRQARYEGLTMSTSVLAKALGVVESDIFIGTDFGLLPGAGQVVDFDRGQKRSFFVKNPHFQDIAAQTAREEAEGKGDMELRLANSRLEILALRTRMRQISAGLNSELVAGYEDEIARLHCLNQTLRRENLKLAIGRGDHKDASQERKYRKLANNMGKELEVVRYQVEHLQKQQRLFKMRERLLIDTKKRLSVALSRVDQLSAEKHKMHTKWISEKSEIGSLRAAAQNRQILEHEQSTLLRSRTLKVARLEKQLKVFQRAEKERKVRYLVRGSP